MKTAKKSKIKSQKNKTQRLTKKSKIAQVSAKVVDDILLKLSPSVQSRIDLLAKKVESGASGVNEFKILALKVLQKAIETGTQFKKNKPRPTTSKKRNRQIKPGG